MPGNARQCWGFNIGVMRQTGSTDLRGYQYNTTVTVELTSSGVAGRLKLANRVSRIMRLQLL